MAVEEHSEEDKALFAMSAGLKNGHNGVFSIEKSPSVNGLLSGIHTKEANGVEDDELTSLSWLQDTDLLSKFPMGNYRIDEENLSDSPSSDYLDEAVEHVTVNGEEGEQSGDTISTHSPYNPTLHADSKPPFSFSCLIFMAIEDSINKALPVKDIYNWILTHFPYFQNAPTGWKNSVRHNLSLSKCFRKVEKEKGQNVGKGSLWCIDPEFRPNLIQALQKAPSMANVEFSHFSCMSPSYCQNGKLESDVKPCLLVSSQQALQIPSPELFPYLSRRLASSIKDPEVDAAATMLTLKNGPSVTIQHVSEDSESDIIQCNHRFLRKRFRLKQGPQHCGAKRSKTCKPVITSSPSEDHTYSACLDQQDCCPSINPASDEDGQRWSDDSKNNTKEVCPSNDANISSKQVIFSQKNEEEEGAHALMNLAEIASKRLLRKVNIKGS